MSIFNKLLLLEFYLSPDGGGLASWLLSLQTGMLKRRSAVAAREFMFTEKTIYTGCQCIIIELLP
jgi:hypothetical protein